VDNILRSPPINKELEGVVATTSDFQNRIADLSRALSATLLHSVVWGASLYFVAIDWERPYLTWAQNSGFGLPSILNQVLKCWDMVLAHPYLTVALFGLLVAADFSIMRQFTRTPLMRLMRDLWFTAILAVPLLLLPLLGMLQIENFLEKQVDPYSILLDSPDIAAEVSLLNGRWCTQVSTVAAQRNENLEEDGERLEFKDGIFQWESREKGIARGMVYFESMRSPKHIQFVAMHPESRWTVRAGIYRVQEDCLVMMLPKWDYLSLPPPLDFEWDDSRYETLILYKEDLK